MRSAEKRPFRVQVCMIGTVSFVNAAKCLESCRIMANVFGGSEGVTAVDFITHD
jgi:hypothetical protein